MAHKSKKFVAKKKKLDVKKHKKAVYKKTVRDVPKDRDETQDVQPQAAQTPQDQAPVVESGFPQPQSAQPQPQPSQPFPQPTIVSPPPTPINTQTTQTQASQDNSTLQPQSQDAKLGIVLQQSDQPAVAQSSPISNSNDINTLPPEFVPPKKSKLWLFAVVVLVIILIAGGVGFYFKSKSVKEPPKKEKEAAVSASSSATPASTTSATLAPTKTQVTPTASQASESASVKVDYSKYEILVLNGSGISGEAAKVKDSLEEKKFVVKDIDNAESSDYEKTIIKAKKAVPKEYLDALKKLLGKTYVLDTEEELRESASADVTIIIGSKKTGI